MVKKKRGNSSVRPERAESKGKPYQPRPSKHAQLQAAAAKKPPVADPAVKPDRRRKPNKKVEMETKQAPAAERTFANHAALIRARTEWVRAGRQTGVQSYGVYVNADPFDPFVAYIQEGGARRVIGAFATPQEAHEAYANEKRKT